jgi:hypothetical protein
MAQTQQRRSSNGSRARASANGSGDRPAAAIKQGSQKTTRAARKSGTPAIAAGAALAGLAAGAALASRGRSPFGGRSLLGGLPGAIRPAGSGGGTARTLLRASQELHSTTCSLNDLAGEIRKVRELAQAGQNRSPIEVVLQGLTRRPGQ